MIGPLCEAGRGYTKGFVYAGLEEAQIILRSKNSGCQLSVPHMNRFAQKLVGETTG